MGNVLDTNLTDMKLFITIAALVSTLACGTADRNAVLSDVTTTMNPVGGSTEVALDSQIQATVSNPVWQPGSGWPNIFQLKENNTGNSLCTDVVYDEGALTATCYHDDLNPNTSYTAKVEGLEDSDGRPMTTGQSTFSTATP